MPPSDSEEESSSEESDSEEERQPVRKARPAVPDEPPKRFSFHASLIALVLI